MIVSLPFGTILQPLPAEEKKAHKQLRAAGRQNDTVLLPALPPSLCLSAANIDFQL